MIEYLIFGVHKKRMNLHGDNDHSANKKPPVKEAIII